MINQVKTSPRNRPAIKPVIKRKLLLLIRSPSNCVKPSMEIGIRLSIKSKNIVFTSITNKLQTKIGINNPMSKPR
jgi:hypothetical protein